MRKNSISFITSLLTIVTITLTSCSHHHQHHLSQDEIDAGVNQHISQVAKGLLAEPTSGKPLCMLLTYKDLESAGIGVAYKDTGSGDTCYSQIVSLDERFGSIFMYYVEPPEGTPLRYDAYTNYHVVSNHNMADTPDYRTDTDIITIHNTPVIREYASKVPSNTDSNSSRSSILVDDDPRVTVECTLFTRIPQGMIHLTYNTTQHYPVYKNHTCGVAEKTLTILLDRAVTRKRTPQYCLATSYAWLAAHRLTTYPPNNYCQNQIYYYLPRPLAQQQKTIGSISIRILNNVKDTKYYERDNTKSILENHTIYTKILDPTVFRSNIYDLYLPMKDHNMLSISTSSSHISFKELEQTAKQITLYQIHHNLPQ